MSDDPIAMFDFESMIFQRHLIDVPGRSRRSGGSLDQSAYTLLSILDTGGPASISELSDITGLDASTLNRQTSALLRDGLAERIADPAGGIARKFVPTPQGADALHEEREASEASIRRLTSDWSETDLATLAELLRRMNLSIEERTGRHWPRP